MIGRHPLTDWALQHTAFAVRAVLVVVLVAFLIHLVGVNVGNAWRDGFLAGRATCLEVRR